MSKFELTPAFLDRLQGLARNCQEPIWEVNVHGNVVSASDEVAICGFLEDADFIAEADPATVLALVEEIETLRAGLKASCPHWQQDGDGINEWRRCCTNSSYTIPEGGESSEFCPDCGGKVEVLDYDPNIESEARQ